MTTDGRGGKGLVGRLIEGTWLEVDATLCLGGREGVEGRRLGGTIPDNPVSAGDSERDGIGEALVRSLDCDLGAGIGDALRGYSSPLRRSWDGVEGRCSTGGLLAPTDRCMSVGVGARPFCSGGAYCLPAGNMNETLCNGCEIGRTWDGFWQLQAEYLERRGPSSHSAEEVHKRH